MVTYLSGERIQGRSDDVVGTASFTPSSTFNVEYLIVGAGAAGGQYNGGGGGAGAYRIAASQELTSGVKYSVIVGAKGTASPTPTPTTGYGEGEVERVRRTGNDTSFIGTGLSIISSGGGWGAGPWQSGHADYDGNGSAGGGGNDVNGGDGGTYGNDGGNGGNQSGGGGGGADTAGDNQVTNVRAGHGGNGLQNDITGTNLYYAGGGGAGSNGQADGDGGLGGAGDGSHGVGASDASASGSNAGYGSGGGGAGGNYQGGDGFGGVVIIRFLTSGNSGTLVGGTSATDGSYTVITFTSANSPEVAADKSTVTNVAVGTRYEETDTRKIFHRRTQTGGAGGESWVEKGTALAASALRGLFGGGQPNSVLIDYIAIQTLGNAADFGDLITAREFPAACADSTRGVWAAGGDPLTTVIEYVTVATLGNAVDFGASTTGSARRELSGVADSTRGVFSGGTMSGGTETNTQDFITIQTTGTCADFGDLSATRASMAGCASATRGVVAGGYNSSNAAQDWIDYFTIQTTGSASDAGNLMESVYAVTGCSDLSRGIIAGGNAGGNTNRIQWITISSTANAQDFGDLTVARSGTAACADSTRGVIGGGYNHPPGHRVDTDYITIQTTGNATDFGDLTTSLAARGGLAA